MERQPRNGQHRFCTTVCRERAKATTLGKPARYGYAHQKLRKELAPTVAAGLAVCARCGEPIHPDEPWDLDHADDGVTYLGVSHAAHNRATSRPAEPAPYPQDDPKRGIFYGPPDEADPLAEPRRWSRPWFSWR